MPKLASQHVKLSSASRRRLDNLPRLRSLYVSRTTDIDKISRIIRDSGEKSSRLVGLSAMYGSGIVLLLGNFENTNLENGVSRNVSEGERKIQNRLQKFYKKICNGNQCIYRVESKFDFEMGGNL